MINALPRRPVPPSHSPYSMLFSTDSPGSSLRARRPCLELLCTNMLSDTARTGPSTLTVVDRTTWKEGKEQLEVRGGGNTWGVGGGPTNGTGDSHISPQVI